MDLFYDPSSQELSGGAMRGARPYRAALYFVFWPYPSSCAGCREFHMNTSPFFLNIPGRGVRGSWPKR